MYVLRWYKNLGVMMASWMQEDDVLNSQTKNDSFLIQKAPFFL